MPPEQPFAKQMGMSPQEGMAFVKLLSDLKNKQESAE